MAIDRWRRVSELYHAALARAVEERAAFVGEACAGDEALRREVESLLGQASAADVFLEPPALEAAGRRAGPAGPAGVPGLGADDPSLVG